MAFIPCANTASIGFEMDMSGTPASCVLHAEHDSAITIVDMQNLGTGIIDAIHTFASGTHLPGHTSLNLNVLKITDLTTSSSPTIDWIAGSSTVLPYNGTVTGDVAAAQVASVVTWQTVKRGRSFRGRSFFPGLPSSALANQDEITTAWQANMNDFWGAIHSAINTADSGTWTHVIVSRQEGHVVLTAGVMTEISSRRMNLRVGTQRRRVGA